MPAIVRSYSQVIDDSFQVAFKRGVAGMAAQAANILPLMWMRTIMEYQYKHGGSFTSVVQKLYAEGGVPRFYRGLVPALALAPLARFGDAASNELALASLAETNVPLALKTVCASATAATFRVIIMPLDSWKTTKQVQGKEGLQMLLKKTRSHPAAFWHGGTTVFLVTLGGHYPFWFTRNHLQEALPPFTFSYGKYVRNAVIGFLSSIVSDTLCNPVRVLKVQRQTSPVPVGYFEAGREILAAEGLLGLWGRGLKTRIMSNGIQGSVFMVVWNIMVDVLEKY
mmetsp:Transcript_11338/g.26125  ORF Transcript_11338/g.26125 Transcript_11338/m.26125 type:complete len:282 (+) Transcript_11338:133-978(+)|eukprot:CAMPEP_0178390718 /NCGR_PEP_ID=MMETSP0689_2-20121128/10790_1 /TAXON_ID=160604 /ORGANISM="Amphidinium massartii, Strain CS-259" /LENGTH=281 /DNA_ID=CAMNT_0020011235 /DNA_START=54 /DNA_END=899 /DNA_ORIENTATION=+